MMFPAKSLTTSLPQKDAGCNNHHANNDSSVSKKGLDCTGIGATACLRNGFFAPESAVDLQLGEQYV